MNASYEWLRDFVPFDATPDELRDLITRRVATVDDLAPLRADLAAFVIGYVVEAEPHPDSDHLSVTKVDDGSGELLDVVCGAPNVQAGKKYPFARTGTVMPAGLTIERRKIRGKVSNGMLCSANELKLGAEQDGIMELDTDAAPGTPFLKAYPTGDYRLDVDTGANRPDLLSHLGLAREIAAAVGGKARFPTLPGVDAVPRPSLAEHTIGERQGKAGGVRVRVEDQDGIRALNVAVIRGVRVGPSPEWLVERLTAIGLRSINNVVDATNYMLHAVGQPMHAFDLGRMAGPQLVVRRAHDGEKLVTLDGVERTLTTEMTVIADTQRAQAVAGVMGGRESEVTDTTTDILLEVASFEPRRVRATRRSLGMSTDASYRFERGVPPQNGSFWLQQAARLIVSLADGEIGEPALALTMRQFVSPRVDLRVKRVGHLLGVTIPEAEVATLLESVGFVIHHDVSALPDTLSVLVPHHRTDVTGEADLIEEVARLRGYDSFPSDIRPYRTGRVPDDPQWTQAKRLRDVLVACGMFETRAMPFVAGVDESHVRVQNPLAENEAHLRSNLLETLGRRAELNLSHMQRNVRLFEIGAAFGKVPSRLPREEMRVAALIMGDSRPAHFTEAKPPQYDEWDAKWIAQRLVEVAFPSAEATFVPAHAGAHGGRLWDIVIPGRRVGIVRRVELDAPVWASPAFGVELVLGVVPSADVAPPKANAHGTAAGSPALRTLPKYRPLPAQPAADFDLAILVPSDLAALTVEETLRKSAGELLERIELFDEFTGAGVPDGYRSLAWRLTFRHPERTLRDKEIEGRRAQLLRTLENELGVRPRAG